ncbi:SMC-Scp complex subunit ScpB [Adhaeretor mobilis]|uniref:SMC-Scp complex subunit ScpB n=1 Tax=Adhaeretor mobilis TaxID=1930276 RepID=A0A517MRD7_9BACT|nr:SMC-Scp complex subunit ScpB [Adhaeretor mobilis]QDS97453.1 hypothetical protein HG15A2_07140 [Adhaeretor mobilis]
MAHSPTTPAPSTPAPKNPSPKFSLARLSTAFAKLMTSPNGKSGESETAESQPQVARVSPKMIVEGLLFVGDEQRKPLTSETLAGPIRDVSPEEIENLVKELNDDYTASNSAYEIVSSGGGYSLQLREPLVRLRDRFYGEVRETKLTPAALEVLSIVAYRQPLTADAIGKLRGTKSQAILANLVRRELLGVQSDTAELPVGVRPTRQYVTTVRFNRLFGIASPEELPRSAEHADS